MTNVSAPATRCARVQSVAPIAAATRVPIPRTAAGMSKLNATPVVRRMGSHASGPVQTSAIAVIGIGHHATVATSTGVASSGFRRHAGTHHAAINAIANTHHGAGAARRADALSLLDTVRWPAAHQIDSATNRGPRNACV